MLERTRRERRPAWVCSKQELRGQLSPCPPQGSHRAEGVARGSMEGLRLKLGDLGLTCTPQPCLMAEC